MQLYAHWLDGEYLRLVGRSEGTGAYVQGRAAVRLIKLHALLGTELVLNDVQVLDSSGVLALFADRDAEAFVRGYRELLQLRVFLEDGVSDSQFNRATAGLRRALRPGWTSSLLPDASPLVALADEIMADGYVDLDRPSGVVQRYTGFAPWLNAVRRAVSYFASTDTPDVLRANRNPITYWDILQQLAKKPLESSDADRIAHTIDFIERCTQPAERFARSAVRAHVEKDWARNASVWHNIVLAWNAATERTLEPDGGSGAGLPDAVVPCEYLDDVQDCLAPFRAEVGLLRELSGPQAESAGGIDLDIDSLSWTKIREICEDTQVRATRNALSAARLGRDRKQLREALASHLRILGRLLVPTQATSTGGWVWVVAGKLVVYFGPPIFGQPGSDVVGNILQTGGALDVLQAGARTKYRQWKVTRALHDRVMRNG